MPRKKATKEPQAPQPDQQGITRITISNFKSIVGEQSIDIRPLTILAGANSSGKSSMMQPLLLLKQTLEAPYDPGALLLDGPNVKFSQAEQLLARRMDGIVADTFSVGIMQDNDDDGVVTFLKKSEGGVFEVEKTIHKIINLEYCIRADMTLAELNEEIASLYEKIVVPALDEGLQQPDGLKEREFAIRAPDSVKKAIEALITKIRELHEITPKQDQYPFALFQNRCFLDFFVNPKARGEGPYIFVGSRNHRTNSLHRALHLPGFRGSPQRTYPLIPLGPNFTNFSGTFENYTASVIASWQRQKDQQKLALLNRDLTRLGLTNKIVAQQVSGAHIELLVNRLLHGQDGAEDLVNIADVGFGVSQALPVVVALHAAEPGQLVYIEQPEIHLHPRAQCAIAEVLADAALAGKRVVIETHSDLVLSSIQTLVAEGKLPPELVKLHWFEQLPDGSTKITSADLDKAGAFGAWPEDFHTVILSAENRYLNAAEAQLMGE